MDLATGWGETNLDLGIFAQNGGSKYQSIDWNLQDFITTILWTIMENGFTDLT